MVDKECDLGGMVTPCFVIDEAEFQRGIAAFRNALELKFSNATIGYSVKTNSLPYALLLAHKSGCKAEVVSDDELQLALKCGFSMQEIIFNGPMKSERCFLDAVIGGAIVNIETHRELDWLRKLPTNRVINIGIRVNVNISDISTEDADGENDFSRFGFSDSTSELANALDTIRQLPNVRLAGLHFHRTSHSRSIRFYANLCKYACHIIKKYNLSLDYLDLGGGYFGIFRNAPTFEDYSDAIYNILAYNGLQHLNIIVEPGNALTASAFYFLTSAIDVKQLPDCRIITTDGSRNDIDPFFRKSKYLCEIIRTDLNREPVGLQIITGATCLEYDQLFRLENDLEIKVGDKIRYNNVGAYTLTLTPLFINYFPRVYASDGKRIKLVRDKWGANELMQKSIIEI